MAIGHPNCFVPMDTLKVGESDYLQQLNIEFYHIEQAAI